MYLAQTLGPDPLAPARNTSGGVLQWIRDHTGLLVFILLCIFAILFLIWLVKEVRTTRTLQRDAHEVNKRDRLASCNINRRPSIRVVECTGTASREGTVFGRYRGDVPGHELQYVAIKPGWLAKTILFAYSPISDETGPGSRSLLLRGKGALRTRDYWFLQVDADDPEERKRWCTQLGWDFDISPVEFTEKVKSYYWKGISNDVSLIEGLDAIEDERFVAQEVTRTKFERTETIDAPVEPRNNDTQHNEGSGTLG